MWLCVAVSSRSRSGFPSIVGRLARDLVFADQTVENLRLEQARTDPSLFFLVAQCTDQLVCCSQGLERNHQLNEDLHERCVDSAARCPVAWCSLSLVCLCRDYEQASSALTLREHASRDAAKVDAKVGIGSLASSRPASVRARCKCSHAAAGFAAASVPGA